MPLKALLSGSFGAGGRSRRSASALSDAEKLSMLDELENSGLGWFWACDKDGNLTYLSQAISERVELPLEALEEGEGVRRGPRETRQHPLLVEPADLARVALHHRVAHRNLSVAADDYLAVASNRQNGGAPDLFHFENRCCQQAVHCIETEPGRRNGSSQHPFRQPGEIGSAFAFRSGV